MTVVKEYAGANLQYLTMAKAFFGTHHPLFSAFKIDIDLIGNGHAVMRMPFSDALADRRGALHRGALVTLLDTTCGLAIFSALTSLKPIATIDLRVDFLRLIPPAAELKAVVDCVGTTETVAYIIGRAFAGEGDELIATVAGSFAIDTMGPAFGDVPQGKPR